jgi:hypothetical protein
MRIAWAAAALLSAGAFVGLCLSMTSCGSSYDVGPGGVLGQRTTVDRPDGRREETFVPATREDTWDGKLKEFAFVEGELRPGDRLRHQVTHTAELPLLGSFEWSQVEILRDGAAPRVHRRGWARFWVRVGAVSLIPFAAWALLYGALLWLHGRAAALERPKKLLAGRGAGVG